ncbi:hypothetical protein CDD83_2066 [Cordyceps sp. RAO-2017]|nr:hypothetical protein CDD83_2066 [Cordyceps sp. RAO-2017]
MKSSMLLAAAGALLATASPLPGLEKRLTRTITEWVYATQVDTAVVTLQPGQEAPAEQNEVDYDFDNDDQDTDPVFDEPPPPSPSEVYVEPSHAPFPPAPTPEPKQPEPEPEPVEQPPPSEAPSHSRPAPKEKPNRGSYPPPPSGDDGGHDDYAKTMLKGHNDARSQHKASPLKWSPGLAKTAQESAEQCISNHDNHDKEVDGKGFGQNLAWNWDSSLSEADRVRVGAGGVELWYDEKKDFGGLYGVADPVTSGDFHKFGHFTQMVWADTGLLGCGTHLCQDGKWTTVCNYQNAGNVDGRFAENVLPSSS